MIVVQGHERLQAIAERLRSGTRIEPLTVREFLSWFGAKRRGVWVVSEILSVLENIGLTTEPDFESTYIDGQIDIRLVKTDTLAPTDTSLRAEVVVGLTLEIDPTIPNATSISDPIDPTHRISKLAAANNAPVSVHPDASLQEAVTIMLSRGFSQLPSMSSTRKVEGVISWSSIGSRLGSGLSGSKVKDFVEQHHEVRQDASIFQVIPVVVANDYVLVRGRDNTVAGIITASDLSLQFLQLSEPFLLLSEIENQIRQAISKRFDTNDLASCRDPLDTVRTVEGASDLTFGEYIRLLENPENWRKSNLPLDRVVFCKQLAAVRDIRNDVMHFDPDGISPEDVETLREFARFLQKLSAMGIA